jgi:hypothetical protein
MNMHPADAHVHVGKTRRNGKALKFLLCRHIARCTEARSGVFTNESGKRFPDRAVIEASAAPHAQSETTATIKYPAHFPQSKRLVKKELQPLLT